MVEYIKQAGMLKITGTILAVVVTISISIIAWNAQIGYSMIKENKEDLKAEIDARYKQNEVIITVAQNQKHIIKNQEAIIKKVDYIEKCSSKNTERIIKLEN